MVCLDRLPHPTDYLAKGVGIILTFVIAPIAFASYHVLYYLTELAVNLRGDNYQKRQGEKGLDTSKYIISNGPRQN